MALTKRTKTTTILSLSIGVWNVNGLVSKDFDELNDISFLNCIKFGQRHGLLGRGFFLIGF
jgi:hypothetical protein